MNIWKSFPAIGLGLGLAMALVQGAAAQQNPVTAIDIALEPDATMIQHAMAANARLLKSFPKGFALDETHHPHISMLQQFVRTDDLDKVFAAANAVMAKEKPTAWTLKAFKYYYIPSPPLGLAGIVVEPTEDLHRLQDELITAVEPYTVKTGTPAAFFSDEGGRDIQKSLIGYVANFVTRRSGQALQSARDDRRRNGNIFEQDAGGAIPVVHVLAGWRVGLSAWQLWHGSEGTQGVDAVRPATDFLQRATSANCRTDGFELSSATVGALRTETSGGNDKTAGLDAISGRGVPVSLPHTSSSRRRRLRARSARERRRARPTPVAATPHVRASVAM